MRGGRGTRCRVQNAGSSRDRHVRSGHAPYGHVAPLAYRLWAERNTPRRPWSLSFTHAKDYAGALSVRLRECWKSCLSLRPQAKPLQRESHESTSIGGRG
jgi:hypothetical protein